jgi:hypothetical protein
MQIFKINLNTGQVVSEGKRPFPSQADILVVDDKAGYAYEASFARKGYAVLKCEDATEAYILMPNIVDARPRVALVSYSQGVKWGQTPTSKDGFLDRDGIPALINGVDLARELKQEIPGIYVHLVSDLLDHNISDVSLPDWDALVKDGVIDSYSTRTSRRKGNDWEINQVSLDIIVNQAKFSQPKK